MPEKNRSVAEMKRLADAAAGRIKCDVVIKNARYLDVFNAELRTGDIAVCGGKIVGIGSYNGMEEYDFGGNVVVPGLIDSHMHIESTQLCPEEFAALAVPRGTTVVIADPHEIVNVCGLAGAEYIRRAAARTPLEVKLMLPSCVPATPFETSGAVIDADATARALKGGKFFGLGEMMNYPAVAAGDEEVLSKIAAAGAAGKLTDGHAPAMSGRELNSYIVSGVRTDHECDTAGEAAEKVARGMYVLLREGSASHDLKNLLPAVNANNFRRFALCTDDRHADGLAAEGHIDHVLRTAVKCGLKGEMAALEQAMLENRDISSDEQLAKHAEWAEDIKKRHPDINSGNISGIIRDEIGHVFAKVLEHAGVYKRTPEGTAAFIRFAESVK